VAFEPNGTVFQDARHVVSGLKDARVAEHHQGTGGRAVYRAERGFEHRHTGGLAAHQSPRHMKAVLRQARLVTGSTWDGPIMRLE
jgi:hypothetical protein